MKKPKANRLGEETKNLILRLFKEGLRQRDICEKFNLGKSTVNYIVRPKTRERTKERQQKRRTVFIRKIDSFFDRKKKKIKDPNRAKLVPSGSGCSVMKKRVHRAIDSAPTEYDRRKDGAARTHEKTPGESRAMPQRVPA